MKQCSRCAANKGVDEFYSRGRDVPDKVCIECRRAARRRSYSKNRDVEREKSRINGRAYYEENREKCREQSREWRRENPDYRVRMRTLRNKSYHKDLESSRSRRRVVQMSRRRKLDPADEPTVLYAEAILRMDPCSYCGNYSSTTMQVDHIVPVCNGGGGTWVNMTAACKSCNSSKGTKSLLEYLLD